MDDLKAQAMFAELEAHRSILGTRCVELAAILAKANERIKELEHSSIHGDEELKHEKLGVST